MSRGLRAAIRDLAELGRVSNLPTVLTNVLTGGAIGLAAAGAEHSFSSFDSRLWSRLTLSACAVAMFYIAGMALNDVADVAIDRVERPNRPIPSGRMSRGRAIGFVTWLFIGGLALLGFIGLPALACGAALVAVIVAYDLLHTVHPASVVLMGLCRGLVYLVAATAVASWPPQPHLLLVFGGTITAYVILLTVIARSETQQTLDRRRWLALLLPAVIVVPAVFQLPSLSRVSLIVGSGVVLSLWLLRAARFVTCSPPRTRNAVMAWLAGICLLDAFFLVWLGRPWWALIAAACFVITTTGHRRITGT